MTWAGKDGAGHVNASVSISLVRRLVIKMIACYRRPSRVLSLSCRGLILLVVRIFSPLRKPDLRFVANESSEVEVCSQNIVEEMFVDVSK